MQSQHHVAQAVRQGLWGALLQQFQGPWTINMIAIGALVRCMSGPPSTVHLNRLAAPVVCAPSEDLWVSSSQSLTDPYGSEDFLIFLISISLDLK